MKKLFLMLVVSVSLNASEPDSLKIELRRKENIKEINTCIKTFAILINIFVAGSIAINSRVSRD